MAAVELWCRVSVVDADGGELASCVLEGPSGAVLAAVDTVARLTLLARRLGGDVVLEDLTPRMRELLEFAGLCLETQGQAEAGEEPLRVKGMQEEGHRGDLAP
jgi:hypothetical protein